MISSQRPWPLDHEAGHTKKFKLAEIFESVFPLEEMEQLNFITSGEHCLWQQEDEAYIYMGSLQLSCGYCDIYVYSTLIYSSLIPEDWTLYSEDIIFVSLP